MVESADCRLWKGALILLCSCSPMGDTSRQSFQWLVNYVWILHMNLVKRGYGVSIQVVSSDSSQLVMEIAGDCNEPGQPRKCEVLLATFF